MTDKKRKIAVLGTGNVGATTAFTLMHQGVASEIVLVDINKEKAEGEALDLAQCALCAPACKVWMGEYEDCADCDIIIVTFGVGRKPGQTRLDLAKINVGILTSTMPKVAKIAPNAIYVIVSNPVDVLTYATIKCTNLKPEQVIGTGTLLDSNRLAEAVGAACGVNPQNVNAYVLGEHGDACMAPWSLCTVAGIPVKSYMKDLGISDEEMDAKLDDIYTGMVAAGSKIIKAKGATFYAIGSSVVQLVKAIISNRHTILPLSTLLNGEYGANNMCTGVPVMVGSKGVEKIVIAPLTAEEKALFDEKNVSLSNTYDALGVRDLTPAE
jgi:L-lactate dehydrogenase